MKRLFDVALAGITMFSLAPMILLLAVAIRLKLGRPVLFRQRRPGRHGKPFTILKFRSMTNQCDEKGHLLPDEQRLTGFGQFLRKSSLDELPELWNVVRGDMSLVGPRPLLLEYVSKYTKHQARRNEVRPGITGWAQINGRNSITWEDKFDLDVWYVDNQTFFLDIKILFITIKKVFQREGISAAGEATMPKFLGTSVDKKR